MIKVLLIVRTDRGFVLGTIYNGNEVPLQFDYNASVGVPIIDVAIDYLSIFTGIKSRPEDLIQIASEWSDVYKCHTIVYAYRHRVECPPYGQPYNCCELEGDQTLIRRAFFALSPNANEDTV